MFIDPLPKNAVSSFEISRPGLLQSRGLLAQGVRTPPRYNRHASHNQARRAETDMIDPAVEITPADLVTRRTTNLPGMAVEIVEAPRCDRVESRFCAPIHMLAAYERGVRHDGATIIEGLPKSTLRDFRRKLSFVPAGLKFHDWQDLQSPVRAFYFYIDPAALAISWERDLADISVAPRLFFEDGALWDTALKLITLIDGAGSEHRLYMEALGVILMHELLRLNAGTRRVEPPVRGGLAAWQQRIVTAYVEEHLDEAISLATLAQLVRLSPHYFCRAFKQSFGMPPHRFHTSRRIERAKLLLAKPSPSVTDIGFTVGFSQTSSFTAAFHKATGMTPTGYHRSRS